MTFLQNNSEIDHLAPLLFPVLECTASAVIVHDDLGTIRFANSTAGELFGGLPSQLLGRPWDEFFVDAGPLVLPSPKPATHLSWSSSFEHCRMKSLDGQIWEARVRCRSMGAFGRDWTVCTIDDLSEQLQTLRESDQRLIDVLDNTAAVVYLKDLSGRYLFLNRQFEKLFNVTLESTRGRDDFAIFPHEMAAAFRANDIMVARRGEAVELEEVAPHADGPHTYCSLKFPLRNEQGEIYAIAGVSTDITDRLARKRAEHEVEAARLIQRYLYPATPPHFQGWEIAGHALPAFSASGDYYDFIPLADSRLAVVIADVSGHGMGPALEMVETRAFLRALLEQQQPLDDVMTRLNSILCGDMPSGMFVTMFLGIINASTQEFSYIGAGHDATIVRDDGTIDYLPSTGVVLGLLENHRYPPESRISLSSGDLVLLVTDGVIESISPSGELFGRGRMENAIQRHRTATPDQIIDRLFAETSRFINGTARKDDATAVVVKCR